MAYGNQFKVHFVIARADDGPGGVTEGEVQGHLVGGEEEGFKQRRLGEIAGGC